LIADQFQSGCEQPAKHGVVQPPVNLAVIFGQILACFR
jgi:hypothetical protein